jgi:uncharacterized membrane-anchored protein YjiN (DUF445 family)
VVEVTPGATGELLARVRRLLAEQPLAPVLADLLDAARTHAWHERMVAALAGALGDALDRPALRETIGDIVDALLQRYREGMTPGSRLLLGMAQLFGVVDRERLVTALQTGLREIASDPAHPLRVRIAEAIAELPARLRADATLAGRIEALKAEALESPAVARLAEEAAAAVREALAADLDAPDSEVVGWIAGRLERARQALIEDAALRKELDAWAKARVIELIERYHGRLAQFIENGVRALGPEGAVRLIEEHAGDDLQYIRLNGTVVGGLAGGAIYGVHLMVRFL